MIGEINYTYVLIAIFTMAIVTYLIRAVPFALVRNKIQNRFLRSFLEYIPYGVLAAMTFPAILYSTANLPSGIAGLAAAVILAYCGKSLLTVAAGASLAALIAAQLTSLM